MALSSLELSLGGMLPAHEKLAMKPLSAGGVRGRVRAMAARL
jgi:hypothetical protein